MAEIEVKKKVYGRNRELADENRQRFSSAKLLVLNLISSPGSGKTSLLERTAVKLGASVNILAVKGDVETERDADRLRQLGFFTDLSDASISQVIRPRFPIAAP